MFKGLRVIACDAIPKGEVWLAKKGKRCSFIMPNGDGAVVWIDYPRIVKLKGLEGA